MQGDLALGEAAQGVVIPKTALRQEQQQWFVWVVENKKLVKRNITIDIVDDKTGQVLVSQGVVAGDTVVLAQLNAQAANMPINMVE